MQHMLKIVSDIFVCLQNWNIKNSMELLFHFIKENLFLYRKTANYSLSNALLLFCMLWKKYSFTAFLLSLLLVFTVMMKV